MLPSNRVFAFLMAGLLLTAPCLTARADQATAPAPVTHRHRAHKKQARLVLPPLPGGPLQQVPLNQLPPSEPKVTYENGLLSIAAQNSTLAEILGDVRRLTGASVELPPNGAQERVVTQLGPGAPRDVLALLLNGTAFNYVMLGSTSDPNAVATIVITPKLSSGETQTAANTPPAAEATPMHVPPPEAYLLPNRAGGAVNPNPPPAAAAAEADDNSDDSDDDKDDDSDQAAQPVQPGGAVVTQPNSDESSTPPNAGPRTPEQILEMLRRGTPGQPGQPGPLPPGLQPPQNPPQQ